MKAVSGPVGVNVAVRWSGATDTVAGTSTPVLAFTTWKYPVVSEIGFTGLVNRTRTTALVGTFVSLVPGL